ncbi:MAG: hypothetical protein AXA67_10195 [Methylothermaceae bacteria B42]|nr:MAG: hypothetical protein AXA67_10195 [Methylothermaceae bacteria B42]
MFLITLKETPLLLIACGNYPRQSVGFSSRAIPLGTAVLKNHPPPQAQWRSDPPPSYPLRKTGEFNFTADLGLNRLSSQSQWMAPNFSDFDDCKTVDFWDLEFFFLLQPTTSSPAAVERQRNRSQAKRLDSYS